MKKIIYYKIIILLLQNYIIWAHDQTNFKLFLDYMCHFLQRVYCRWPSKFLAGQILVNL